MLHDNILKIRDENGLGDIYNEMELHFDSVNITVRDIIIERVYQEVIRLNQKTDDYRHALVVPKDEETLLNGTRTKRKHRIDAEKQVDIALKAFAGNGFFILIDDFQAEDLDQAVTITQDTVISFIKLTPLVGG